MQVTYDGKFIDTESKILVTMGQGGRNNEKLFGGFCFVCWQYLDLNLGPCTCEAGTLLARWHSNEPRPQLFFALVIFRIGSHVYVQASLDPDSSIYTYFPHRWMTSVCHHAQICSGWPQTAILPISTSRVPRIIVCTTVSSKSHC
jgi:hypothetical protein